MQRRATIAVGEKRERLTRIREEASGQDGEARRNSKGSVNSMMREKPDEDDEDGAVGGGGGDHASAAGRLSVNNVEHVRRKVKSMALSTSSDEDSGISGGALGGSNGGLKEGEGEGTFVTTGEEPVRIAAQAQAARASISKAAGGVPLKDRDTWSDVAKSIADIKARRTSRAEDIQPVIVHTLASGYTKTATAAAVGGRKTSEATGPGAASARKRESLSEMAGLGGGGGGGHAPLRKHESLKK